MMTQPTDLPRLTDRVIVVTGASSGIGEQFAHALDTAGARLILAARRTDRVQQVAAGLRNAIAVRCDVADDGERDALIPAAVEHFGRIDGLVNNAGISDVGPALRQDADDFRRVLEVNLVAPFALATAAATAMRRTGGGAIVNIASICSFQAMPATPQASYVASKAGLAGLTRELATQWARYDIRVNALAPGAFTTELTGDAYEVGPYSDMLMTRIPLARPGRPGELDAMLLTLLHPASSYMTGQTVTVDGGLKIA
jgi:NAD(P)-dependent dehydrogenase (short-subunit alcohol dehydrogenase family)